MASRKTSSGPSVAEYIAGLSDPLRTEVEILRQIILGSAEGIGEELKWNAPSFHLGEHFATMRLTGKVPLQLILHLGAKKAAPIPAGAINDPAGILKWLAPDRACIEFAGPGAVAAHSTALRCILGQWVQYVPGRVAG